MKEKDKIIQRIENHYVGEDCIQVSLPYKNSITIIDKEGILYHHLPESHVHINKYLEDNRRLQFPYNNIPTHCARKGLVKYNYTNQLFNYEEPYLEIKNWQIIENFAVKDKESAILLRKTLSGTEKVEYMTRQELKSIFEKQTNQTQSLYNQQLSIIGIDTGAILEPQNNRVEPFKSEEEITTIIKEGLLEQLKSYKKVALEQNYGNKYFDEFSVRCLEKLINNLTIEDIPDDIALDNDNIVIVRTDGQDIFIQRISVKFMKSDYYKVTTVDLPVTKYNLEQIKYLVTEITKTKEPKIPLTLNPGVSKQDIEVAKKLIKRKTLN